jgi:hypothetical protein
MMRVEDDLQESTGIPARAVHHRDLGSEDNPCPTCILGHLHLKEREEDTYRVV